MNFSQLKRILIPIDDLIEQEITDGEKNSRNIVFAKLKARAQSSIPPDGAFVDLMCADLEEIEGDILKMGLFMKKKELIDAVMNNKQEKMPSKNEVSSMIADIQNLLNSVDQSVDQGFSSRRDLHPSIKPSWGLRQFDTRDSLAACNSSTKEQHTSIKNTLKK